MIAEGFMTWTEELRTNGYHAEENNCVLLSHLDRPKSNFMSTNLRHVSIPLPSSRKKGIRCASAVHTKRDVICWTSSYLPTSSIPKHYVEIFPVSEFHLTRNLSSSGMIPSTSIHLRIHMNDIVQTSHCLLMATTDCKRQHPKPILIEIPQTTTRIHGGSKINQPSKRGNKKIFFLVWTPFLLRLLFHQETTTTKRFPQTSTK